MEGIIAYKEVENLKQRISDLEKENAELRKKLETSTAERLGFRSVSFGLPDPEPTCVPRPVWRPCLNPNWRIEGVS
jgi:hypothetical protein